MTSDLPMSFRRALPWALFVTLLFWLNYAARSTLTPLLISVEADLQIGHTAATSLLLMQSLGFSLAQFLSGFLLCRIRAARMAGLCIMVSGLVLTGMLFVQTLPQARLIFLLFGFTAGFYFSAGMSILSSLVRPEDWGKAVAVHELAPNLGFILIPLIAQGALLFTRWQGVFALMGLAMLVIGMAFLRFGKGGNNLAAPPSFRGLRSMVSNPAMWATVALLAIAVVGEFSIYSILQIYLVNAVSWSPQQANILIAASRLATPLAVVVGGWAADRRDPYSVLRVGLVAHAAALGLMCVPYVFPFASGSALLATLAFVGVMGQAMTIALLFPSIFKVMSYAFPADKQPVLLSLCMPLSSFIATGLAPLFLGWCGQYLNFAVGLATVAVLSLCSLLAVRLLARRHTMALLR